MDPHALKVKQNLHSKNAFSWRYTLFLLIIISSKTILINISLTAHSEGDYDENGMWKTKISCFYFNDMFDNLNDAHHEF